MRSRDSDPNSTKPGFIFFYSLLAVTFVIFPIFLSANNLSFVKNTRGKPHEPFEFFSFFVSAFLLVQAFLRFKKDILIHGPMGKYLRVRKYSLQIPPRSWPMRWVSLIGHRKNFFPGFRRQGMKASTGTSFFTFTSALNFFRPRPPIF